MPQQKYAECGQKQAVSWASSGANQLCALARVTHLSGPVSLQCGDEGGRGASTNTGSHWDRARNLLSPWAACTSPDLRENPGWRKGLHRVPSLCSCDGLTSGAPLIFSTSLKGQVAELPIPFGKYLCFFNGSMGWGDWTEGKRGRKARQPAQDQGPHLLWGLWQVPSPLWGSISPSVQ